MTDNVLPVPFLGEGSDDAEIVLWHVSAGDHVVALHFRFEEARQEPLDLGCRAEGRPVASSAAREIERVPVMARQRVEEPVIDVVIVGGAVKTHEGWRPARLVPERHGASVDPPAPYHRASSSLGLASAMAWKRKKRSRA